MYYHVLFVLVCLILRSHVKESHQPMQFADTGEVDSGIYEHLESKVQNLLSNTAINQIC